MGTLLKNTSKANSLSNDRLNEVAICYDFFSILFSLLQLRMGFNCLAQKGRPSASEKRETWAYDVGEGLDALYSVTKLEMRLVTKHLPEDDAHPPKEDVRGLPLEAAPN